MSVRPAGARLRGKTAPLSGATGSGARAIRIEPGVYTVQTQPGLERVALEEVAALVPSSRILGQRIVAERSGIGIFYAPSARHLTRIRTAEDIFALIACRRDLEAGRPALFRIRQVIREMPPFDWALDARVILSPRSRTGRRLRFRVVARMTGEHEFRRADLKRTVELGMGERSDHAWRLDEDRADIELWATLLGDELLVAMRLSGAHMRHRDRAIERPASLRPSVAAAMAFMSAPSDDDVVLDPFCGTGTILIERAMMGRYQRLIGADSDRDAVAVARANIGPRFKPIDLHQWDATAIPLADHSISAIVTNLPWGIRFGSHRENRHLYPRVLAEFFRLLAPGGRIVFLTGETRLVRELMANRTITPVRILPVSILGANAAIYVVGGTRMTSSLTDAQA